MRKRKIWQQPKLRCDENQNLYRPVTWLELYFDIYFVVAVSQLTHQFASNLTFNGLIALVILYLPLIWTWIGITHYMERFETDGLENRLIFIVYMFAVGGMALFAHHGMHENYNGYVISYLFARLFTVLLWNRSAKYNPTYKPIVEIYNTGFLCGLALVGISIFIPAPYKYILLTVGVFSEILTPVFTSPLIPQLPKISTSKYPERFGLFAIVVLGETVIGVIHGLLARHLFALPDVSLGLLGIVLGLSMWWIYFDFVARRPFKQGFPWVYLWVYLHIGIYLSIVIVGAAILNATMNVDHMMPFEIRLATVGGIGLFLICVGLIEYVLYRDDNEPTHQHFSNWKKIIAGCLIPLTAFLNVDRYTFFICFYPFLFIHILYGAYVWFSQELEDDPKLDMHE